MGVKDLYLVATFPPTTWTAESPPASWMPGDGTTYVCRTISVSNLARDPVRVKDLDTLADIRYRSYICSAAVRLMSAYRGSAGGSSPMARSRWYHATSRQAPSFQPTRR